MDRVLAELQALRTEMEGMRGDLTTRPSRREVTVGKRLSMGFVVLLIFVMMQITDVQVQQCSPGSRAWTAIVHEPPIRSVEEARVVADKGIPRWFCDTIFPLTAHSAEDWPSRWNHIGFAVMGVLLTGVGSWIYFGYRQPEYAVSRRARPDDDDPTPDPTPGG